MQLRDGGAAGLADRVGQGEGGHHGAVIHQIDDTLPSRLGALGQGGYLSLRRDGQQLEQPRPAHVDGMAIGGHADAAPGDGLKGLHLRQRKATLGARAHDGPGHGVF